MTLETLSKAKELIAEKQWCESVTRHIALNHRMHFVFDTTRECIESHDQTKCPEWLLDIIVDAINEHKEEIISEFEEL